MAEWSKAVDLRYSFWILSNPLSMMRGFEPLFVQKKRRNRSKGFTFCSYSVVVITSDFESENPSSNLGKSCQKNPVSSVGRAPAF